MTGDDGGASLGEFARGAGFGGFELLAKKLFADAAVLVFELFSA